MTSTGTDGHRRRATSGARPCWSRSTTTSRSSSLDSINIADISRRAGVTRSAFYFYFENKAIAVAALMEEMYDDAFVAAGLLAATEGTPANRIETMLRELFGTLDRHQHVFAAMLEARATSEAVRDDVGRRPAVLRAAGGRHDPGASATPAGPRRDPTPSSSPPSCSSSTTACSSASRSAAPLTRDQQVEAVATIWLRTIYGTPPRRPGRRS